MIILLYASMILHLKDFSNIENYYGYLIIVVVFESVISLCGICR